MEYKINTNEIEKLESLKVGDRVLLTGTVYTARDAAHKRIFELLDKGEPLPFDLNGAFIYYAGPTPTKKGDIIGSCGPTTSSRMDSFAPRLISLGLKGMLGKGERNTEVITACNTFKSVYFCAIGGAGALAASKVKSCEIIAFEDLGCESIKKLTIEDFPLIVAVDTKNGNIFDLANS